MDTFHDHAQVNNIEAASPMDLKENLVVKAMKLKKHRFSPKRKDTAECDGSLAFSTLHCSTATDAVHNHNHSRIEKTFGNEHKSHYPTPLVSPVSPVSLSDLVKPYFRTSLIDNYVLHLPESPPPLESFNDRFIRDSFKSCSITELVQSNSKIFKFLIVDDNPINIMILKKILNKMFNNNCILHSTIYPQEVLNKVFKYKNNEDINNNNNKNNKSVSIITPNKDLKINPNFDYDLIFLDIEMPLITGLQLAEKIRSFQELSTLGLIAFTSLQDERSLKLFKNAGIDYTLDKPMKMQEMDATKRLLEKTINTRKLYL
ncbi:hypothetical protein PACTADRAFT_50903 [Pachysolen tannophilus NRRL Y-2460]|uniref:Response regulatory domain-containing protein n=1 Tax=Pachysolen tannophilus NRRL Y-2460 TaxID=669874 RepID=A0A1E4TTJ6_PACTA|nr:hypothetical protein PACTADRAFT_50903 [Pachysolen tannophilus NRRL Y-2460]